MDKFLGGDGILGEDHRNGTETFSYDGTRETGFAELKRAGTPTLPISERHKGFMEVDLCPSDDQAISEANRCLQCDLEICLAKKMRDSE